MARYFHKIVGYIFVVGIVIGGLSLFFIFSIRMIGPFSPIHLLSIVSLFSVSFALYSIKNKKIKAHKRAMWRLYSQAIGVAGLFAFLPGRLMNDIVPIFAPWVIFGIAAASFLIIAAIVYSAARNELVG
ncbi:MAG: DUF2306 domain-containing protein [Amylibacter sp.]